MDGSKTLERNSGMGVGGHAAMVLIIQRVLFSPLTSKEKSQFWRMLQTEPTVLNIVFIDFNNERLRVTAAVLWQHNLC